MFGSSDSDKLKQSLGQKMSRSSTLVPMSESGGQTSVQAHVAALNEFLSPGGTTLPNASMTSALAASKISGQQLTMTGAVPVSDIIKSSDSSSSREMTPTYGEFSPQKTVKTEGICLNLFLYTIFIISS